MAPKVTCGLPSGQPVFRHGRCCAGMTGRLRLGRGWRRRAGACRTCGGPTKLPVPYQERPKGPVLPYRLPDADVVSIIDAPPTPLASPSPTERFVVLVHYQAHPPVAMLAGPRFSLAGLRLDPGLRGRQRTRQFTGLSVLRIGDGTERPLALPDGAQVSIPVWAPDGSRFAFTVDEPAGIGVWTCDAGGDADPVQVPGLRVSDVLGAEPPGLGGMVRWSRDGRSLLALGVPPGAGGPAVTGTA